MSRKEPRNAHAAGGKVFWLSKTSLLLAGTFPDPFCRESAARHPKNGEGTLRRRSWRCGAGAAPPPQGRGCSTPLFAWAR